MVRIINQPAAIGDIIFLEPMFHYFHKKDGFRPTVPIRDHLIWLAQYIPSADFVPVSNFPGNSRLDTMEHSAEFLNMRFGNQIFRDYDPHDHHDFENMMLDKYRLAGLPLDEWKKIQLSFDDAKGTALLKHLGLMQENGSIKEYTLVNEFSQAGQVYINPKSNYQIVKMHEIPGFTLIDWFLAIQMAQENHHVSTSTFHLMQAISNQYYFDSKVFLYPRPNVDGLRGISKLKPSFEYQVCQ